MKLHCLGTAGYHPNEFRHTSCFFLPEAGIVLDAGTSVFRLQSLIQSDTLSILLSHTHLDHSMGLTFFWDLLGGKTPLKHIHVYAQQEKIDAIRDHLFHPALFPVIPPFVFHSLESLGSSFSIGKAVCTWFPIEHPGGAVGYRVKLPGVDLAYVTDTTCEVNAAYWGEIQGVDWLIHECNFLDEEEKMAIHTGHSWTSAVLSAAAEHGVERLILSHFNPMVEGSDPIRLQRYRDRPGAPIPRIVEMARDSSVIELS